MPGPPRADPRDHVHRRKREQRDDPRPRGQPVDPVGEVDAVGSAGDHEEEQAVPGVRELQRAEARDVHLRREMLVASRDADADRDRAEQEKLPAAVQPQRAFVRELDEVVEEADGAAAERDEEDRERRHGVAAEGEEADAGGDQDQEPAHRRRPLLGDVVLGTLLADVLAELLAPQERDELRAEQDRDEQGDDPCDQDSAQVRTAASASATTSSPTAREAFTRTQSPASTTSSAARIAAGASATQRVTGIPAAP